MKVLLVSQCSKNALVETRRIIDQFAERKGDAIWETDITLQGLDTLKRLLKTTARRNTAIACHLFRGHLKTELLWIVGNNKKFNSEGNVPTNVTSKNVLRSNDENDWNTGEAIAVIASIAGLFHDFGKANKLFQMKLTRARNTSSEPFRHEWISVLLFKNFVGKSTDQEWLQRLSQITRNDEEALLNNFSSNLADLKKNPLLNLPDVAKFIAWLILSHHRLPEHDADNEPRCESEYIEGWKESLRFSAVWNSPNCEKSNEKEISQNVNFPNGTPLLSKTWCFSARKAATRALRSYNQINRNWFNDRFSMHLMRAVLMMSDHFYSAGDAKENHQDDDYHAFANTSKGCLKQKLDEHNIGVALNAFLIGKAVPKLRETLPAIFRQKEFKKRNKNAKFTWQDEAYDLAYSLKEKSYEDGFFGINLASTGSGKTIANARIMYGLSDEKKGCRFSVALGLRVLTLQTAHSLKEKLLIRDDDLAMMIGSKEFQQLHDHKKGHLERNETGSESSEELIDEEDFPIYDGSVDYGFMSRWLIKSPKLHKMISSPILVSTIDYLISATEGCRGGKQIAPILRLLTSDLVLDEPDDFDVADLPALSRLVNFAGVFGSRVLLSSATLPPSIVQALFDAYAAGRKIFNQACRKPNTDSKICCAWFNEFEVTSSEHSDTKSYVMAHTEFIKKHLSHLEQKPVLRKAALVSVKPQSKSGSDVTEAVAKSISKSIYDLHDLHHQIDPGTNKHISFGLVRMANINPLVSVVQKILSDSAQPNYCIHYCVYHSRFPLLIRSKIEEILDSTLSRHDPNKIWQNPEVRSSISGKNELHHVFVVFATSVAEVGRDHDYDWAIAEPSSLRSIIQLAGRVQRHRYLPPTEPNLHILQNNIKGLKGLEVAYSAPGFESTKFNLENKDLFKSLQPFQYEQVTASPRLIGLSENFRNNLSDLEHKRLNADLLGIENNKFHASLWWKHSVDWCEVIQKMSRFRKSDGIDNEYIYYLEDEYDDPMLCEWPEGGKLTDVERIHFEKRHFLPANGIYPWFTCDIKAEIVKLAEEMNKPVKDISVRFARIKLRELKDRERWINDPQLGFYLE